VFLVKDNAKALLWALPASLVPSAAPDTVPVAVMADWPGNGRVVLTTMPFSTSIPAVGGPAPRLIAKVFGLLGLLPVALPNPGRPRAGFGTGPQFVRYPVGCRNLKVRFFPWGVHVVTIIDRLYRGMTTSAASRFSACCA
jgi:hypothetical protein